MDLFWRRYEICFEDIKYIYNSVVQAKLDDVSKRISSSTSHAIFLALASSSGQVADIYLIFEMF